MSAWKPEDVEDSRALVERLRRERPDLPAEVADTLEQFLDVADARARKDGTRHFRDNRTWLDRATDKLRRSLGLK